MEIIIKKFMFFMREEMAGDGIGFAIDFANEICGVKLLIIIDMRYGMFCWQMFAQEYN